MRRDLLVCLVPLFLFTNALQVHAQSSHAYLALDSFSFFFAEGVDAGGDVPTISVPISLTQSSSMSWSLSIAPTDVSFPPITLPDGTRVQWSLLSAASGTISLSETSGTVAISGTFLAQSLDTTRKSIHELSFGTGESSITTGGTATSREGVSLDRASGYVQLVATSSDPPGSEHGVPFYVVLSGRFTGTPEGLLAQ